MFKWLSVGDVPRKDVLYGVVNGPQYWYWYLYQIRNATDAPYWYYQNTADYKYSTVL